MSAPAGGLVAEHGMRGYRRGCRCPVCSAAKAAANARRGRHWPARGAAVVLPAVVCCEREATEPEGSGHDPMCRGVA